MKTYEDLAKTYDPAPIEEKWYKKWIDEKAFHANPDDVKPGFSIVIPPPNVTGSLHMGHALNNTLQDITSRYKRMSGFNVLWLPGTDHAGIATQNVVEREIAKEGLDRHKMGREAFVERIWKWKEHYGNRIVGQLKRLGASCDWDRERFTLDEGLSRAVRAVFVRLYKEDLIYKSKYIINWCTRCHTALSDLEVEHSEEHGKLYFVAYPFVEGGGEIIVATTRPETILGDVAVAVHPRDERNAHLIGKRVFVPAVGREIPIIEDNMVDPAFGTGFVKITPAHDPNDYLVGQRHGLEQLQVIDEKGFMNVESGKYAGMTREECRKVIITDIEQEGLMRKIDDYTHSVGHCYRCRTVIEPYLSEQWFVKTRNLADAAMQAVKAKKIHFVKGVDVQPAQGSDVRLEAKKGINFFPGQWEPVYNQWMQNIRDWCISRQLWWGHRIPAWQCEECGYITVAEIDPTCCEKCGSQKIIQDEDVLDTWFSSALWPFSTMGWPDDTAELRKFYPTSLLVTGFDIIFFWVARMIMMGLKFMGDIPFEDVYIHALVRDEQGQKMSKSKGNVIDPLNIIDRFGADALRFTLASLTVQGRDICLSENRIETYRYFMNKLWNASRFALMNLDDSSGVTIPLPISEGNYSLFDKWILTRLQAVTTQVSEYIDGYFYGEAARLLYDFIWGELCDWYIEVIKPVLKGEDGIERQQVAKTVLRYVFRQSLLLLHPFIPFVTEELWSAFCFSNDSIEKSSWPVSDENLMDKASVEEADTLMNVVKVIRNLRAEAGAKPGVSMKITVHGENDLISVVENGKKILLLMAKVDGIAISHDYCKIPKTLSAIIQGGHIFLHVDGVMDVAAERARLSKEKDKLQKDIDRSEAKLVKPDFVDKAPAEVVEKEKEKLAGAKARMNRIEEILSTFEE